MKRLLCVWLANWPIQRLQNLSPGDGSLETAAGDQPPPPLVVWQDDPRRGRLVVACCRISAARGVRRSMPLAAAVEMAQAGGEPPRVEEQDVWLDQESLGQIATLLQKHISPLVAIESPDVHLSTQPESLFCDIAGIPHLFGGEEGLLRAVEKRLSARGLNARLAIADTMGAAWALAHYAGQATRSPAGNGLSCVAPLPVEALRIAPDTVTTLRRLGIERIDQLLQLPKSGLAARLGQPLLRRIQQAAGEVDEPLTVHRPAAEHTHSLELEYSTSDQKILADRIGQLMKKVRAGLATCNRGALRLACRLDLAIHPPLTCEIGLFAPTLDANHLTGLMVNQIEHKKLPSAVVRVTVSVSLTGPLRSSQASLFTEDSLVNWTSGSAVCRLVDSLSGRLGRDAVVGVAIEADPLPENSFRVWPLTGSDPTSKKSRSADPRKTSVSSRVSPLASGNSKFQTSSRESFGQRFRSPSPQDAMRRPLSLLVRPVPLIVEDQVSLERQLPTCFRLDGVTHRIIRHWGPERIETGWWKGPSIARDYYRVETDRGLWWWIFRNLASEARAADVKSRWMLHGRFA